jgi:hypothetical protein
MRARNAMNDNFDKHVRELCRLAAAAEDDTELQDLLSQLRAALRKHMTGLRGMVADHVLGVTNHPRWHDAPVRDIPPPDVRQPYFDRERESAEGFVTWVRLSTAGAFAKSRDSN